MRLCCKPAGNAIPVGTVFHAGEYLELVTYPKMPKVDINIINYQLSTSSIIYQLSTSSTINYFAWLKNVEEL
jgi:hypothetical protein